MKKDAVGTVSGGKKEILACSRYNPCVYLPLIILTMLLLVSAAGCGDDESGQTSTSSELEAEFGAGPGFATFGGSVIMAEDLPVEEGTSLVYMASDPATETAVDFDLEGPWDFSEGPEEALLAIEYVDIDTTPAVDVLPEEVTTVAKYSWSPSINETEYIFQSVDQSSWKVYGRVDENENTLLLEGTSRALLFPLSLDSEWIDNYIEVDEATASETTTENSAVAINELEVPAGTYEAILIQTRVTTISGDEVTTRLVYSWFVPEIGKAAEIVSLPDETDDIFSRASSVYRLAEYENASV